MLYDQFYRFSVNFSHKTYRKMVTNIKEGTKLSIILSGWEVEMWSIMVELDSVPRVSLDTNCDKSKYSIKLHNFLFKFILQFKMKPDIKIISMCVVCAIDNSSSNRSIYSVVLGGR